MTEAISMGLKQILLKARAKEDKATVQELEKLRRERKKVRDEMEISMNNYNYVTDNGLMDFYIYQIRSQEALEQYLIHEIRKLEK